MRSRNRSGSLPSSRARSLGLGVLLAAAMALALGVETGQAAPATAGSPPPETIRVFVGDRQVTLDVPVQIIDGQVLVPMRPVLEALDMSVAWREDRQVVGLTGQGEFEVPLTGECTEIWRLEKKLQVPVRVVDDHALLPYQYLAEILDVDVRYDATGGIIRIDRRAVPVAAPDRGPEVFAFQIFFAALAGAAVVEILVISFGRPSRAFLASIDAKRLLKGLVSAEGRKAPQGTDVRRMLSILSGIRSRSGGTPAPLVYVNEELSPSLCGLLLLSANPPDADGPGLARASRFWDLQAGEATDSATQARLLLDVVRFRASLDPGYRRLLLHWAGLKGEYDLVPAPSEAYRSSQAGQRYARFYDRPHTVAVATVLPGKDDETLRRLLVDRGGTLKAVDLYLPDPRLSVDGRATALGDLIDEWMRGPGLLLDPLDFPRPPVLSLVSLPAQIILTAGLVGSIGGRTPVRIHFSSGAFLPFGAVIIEDEESFLAEATLTPPGLTPRAGIVLEEAPRRDGGSSEVREHLLRWAEEKRGRGQLLTMETGPGPGQGAFLTGLADIAAEAAGQSAEAIAGRGSSLDRRRLEAVLAARKVPRPLVSVVTDLFSAYATGPRGSDLRPPALARLESILLGRLERPIH